MSQHLLMIEDDARLARMVSEYLGQSGFVVRHADDGHKGSWPCRPRRPTG